MLALLVDVSIMRLSERLMRIIIRGAFVAVVAIFPGLVRPSVAQVLNPALPSLFLIGDSTVRNGQGDGESGAGRAATAT